MSIIKFPNVDLFFSLLIYVTKSAIAFSLVAEKLAEIFLLLAGHDLFGNTMKLITLPLSDIFLAIFVFSNAYTFAIIIF